MKRLAAGIVVLVGAGIFWLLGNGLSLGLGRGSGSDTGDSAPSQPAAATSSSATVKDGVMAVFIHGDKLLVNGAELDPQAIVQLAETHKARVVIQRSADATARAKEDLVKALQERQIVYQVQ